MFRTSLYADVAIERSVGGMVRTSCGAHHTCEYVVKAREDGSGSGGLWIRAVADIRAQQELSLVSSTSTVADAGGSKRPRRLGTATAATAAAAAAIAPAAAAAAAAADRDVDALSSDDDESPTNKPMHSTECRVGEGQLQKPSSERVSE